jgi:hypothetical protein
MRSKTKLLIMMAVFLVAFAGPENAPARDGMVHDHYVPGRDPFSPLDDYLRSYLDDCLPLEKYTSSVRRDAWQRDCWRYPQGMPDPRGEKLFRNAHILDDPSSLDIFFIGVLHTPLFHRELTCRGFKPYFISWHFQENLTAWDPFYILRHLRRDPIVPPEDGEPCIIIGDRHGKNYRIAFPDPIELKKRDIDKVHFHIELLDSRLEPRVQRERLKDAFFDDEIFWGQRKIYQYILQLELHGIDVLIDGIEPRRRY